MEGTLTLAILGHHDMPRFERAIRSASAAAACAPRVVAQPVVDVTGRLDPPEGSWCVEGGTAARAKASLLRKWAAGASEGDWVWQLDGDDVLYPCAAQAMRRDISLACADLVGYYGFDVPDTAELWTGPAVPPWPRGAGVGDHWDCYPYVTSWMPSLWSTRAVRTIRWDEDMRAYEDGLVCYQALALHQRGELRVCISGAVDILAVDRSTPASVQKLADMDAATDELRRRRLGWVARERSNWGELGIIAPSPLMDAVARLMAYLAAQGQRLPAT